MIKHVGPVPVQRAYFLDSARTALSPMRAIRGPFEGSLCWVRVLMGRFWAKPTHLAYVATASSNAVPQDPGLLQQRKIHPVTIIRTHYSPKPTLSLSLALLC